MGAFWIRSEAAGLWGAAGRSGDVYVGLLRATDTILDALNQGGLWAKFILFMYCPWAKNDFYILKELWKHSMHIRYILILKKASSSTWNLHFPGHPGFYLAVLSQSLRGLLSATLQKKVKDPSLTHKYRVSEGLRTLPGTKLSKH